MKRLTSGELAKLIAHHEATLSALRLRHRRAVEREDRHAESAKQRRIASKLGIEPKRRASTRLTLAERQELQIQHFGLDAVVGK